MNNNIYFIKKTTSILIVILEMMLSACSIFSEDKVDKNSSSDYINYKTTPISTYSNNDSIHYNVESIDIGSIEIDSIVFEKKLYLDCESCSHPIAHVSIPVVKSNNENNMAIVDSINKYIERELDIKLSECDEDFLDYWIGLRCGNLSFDYIYHSHYLYLNMEVLWLTAHGDPPVNIGMTINLNDGKKVEYKQISFKNLFTEQGYFDFLEKCEWEEKMKSEFKYSYELVWEKEKKYLSDTSEVQKEIMLKEAYDSAESEMHNISYKIEDSTLIFYCHSSPFGWALRCYDPYVEEKIKFEDVKPYLSKGGEKFIFERDSSRNIIERLLWEIDLYDQMEEN